MTGLNDLLEKRSNSGKRSSASPEKKGSSNSAVTATTKQTANMSSTSVSASNASPNKQGTTTIDSSKIRQSPKGASNPHGRAASRESFTRMAGAPMNSLLKSPIKSNVNQGPMRGNVSGFGKFPGVIVGSAGPAKGAAVVGEHGMFVGASAIV